MCIRFFFSFVFSMMYFKNMYLFFECKKVPPPKDGRFGPKFPDPRALPMRGDFFPYRGAPFRRPKPTFALPTRGDSALFLWGDFAVASITVF